MNRKLVFGRVAGIVSATVLLAAVGCSTTRYERSTGEYVDDQILNRRVHHALAAQPVYKYPDVHVHSYRGVVQLSGFAATEAQKQAATEIAQRVRGVGEVENSISIAPLAQDNLRDFIPGRAADTNEANRSVFGRPGRSTGTTSGSTTNEIHLNTNTNTVR